MNSLNEHNVGLVVLVHTKICLKVKHDLESLLNFNYTVTLELNG